MAVPFGFMLFLAVLCRCSEPASVLSGGGLDDDVGLGDGRYVAVVVFVAPWFRVGILGLSLLRVIFRFWAVVCGVDDTEMPLNGWGC